jgi:outer membrane protein OmpA-like peptidoglycan-associated protein
LALFQSWHDRLDRVEQSDDAAVQYHRAKADAWLTLGREEYQVNDRTGVVEAAFAQAKQLIGRLETSPPQRITETALLSGSVRVREDLWGLAERLKDNPGFRCAAPAVARLEVALIWAGNEQLTCGPDDPRHRLADAEAAARNAERLAASCVVPPPAPQLAVKPQVKVRERAPSVQRRPAPIPETLIVPNVIHFAFDRADLSPRSVAVLDRIVEVIREYPDLRVVMFGHTDRRGSDTYNYALARRRAEAANAYLLSMGITSEQVRMVSEGEARLMRGGESNVDHAHNRRVEFEFYTSIGRRIETVFQEADLQLEEEERSR